ncbi:MAG: hypothetical protein GX060_02835 [Firmicutes bacterium]|nr:hypothetical protein [Bacillota bacterium]
MDVLTNPLFLMCMAIFLGYYLGKISLARFKLGISGTLFAGMALSWLVYRYGVEPFADTNIATIPPYVSRILANGLVEAAYFDFLLLLFVAAVGLLAAQDVAKVFRGNGLKFMILAVVITSTGAATAYLLFRLIPGLNPLSIAGVYTGALTSSPGLGVALEVAGSMFADPLSAAARTAQASVGLGYAVAYPFSVITVITGMQLLPKLFGVDSAREAAELNEQIGAHKSTVTVVSKGLDMRAFALVALTGFCIGRISIPLASVGSISLGTTGGVLVAALVLGARGRLGPISLWMNAKALNVVKQLALYFFLAYVGLNYGHQAVAAMAGPNALLVLVGMLTTAMSLLVGFLFGRYVLHMNWVLLSGAICGAMTSTPGLGAAIDTTGRNEAAGGYGATYPIGLLCKVLLVLLLNKLPL